MQFNLLTILGPTAVGKTRLATNLALELDGEIISADSRQVYRGMDIGTGKDLDDYLINGVKIPYYLIDIVDPACDEFSLFNFVEYFKVAYRDIVNRGKFPMLVGGTGLYIHSLLKGYDLPPANISKKRAKELSEMSQDELNDMLLKLNPQQHNVTDLTDKERTIRAIAIEESRETAGKNVEPELNSLVLGVKGDREIIKENITKRLKNRLQNGMIEEVEMLLASGVSKEKMEFFGLEYKYISHYINGQMNYNDMFQKLNSAIHKFAKRQMTWFRKMEREGIEIHWLEGPEIDKAKEIIKKEEFCIS